MFIANQTLLRRSTQYRPPATYVGPWYANTQVQCFRLNQKEKSLLA